MAKMVLGAYTFDRDPDLCTVIKEDRLVAKVDTYSSVAVFSWGTTLVGKEMVLGWHYMTQDHFDNLQTLIENDATVVWNPQTGTNYNVELMKLEGEYLESSLLLAAWRKDVVLTMVIISTV